MSRGAGSGVAMPLDSGGLSDLEAQTGEGQPSAPTIYSGGDVGQALKAMREARGMSLEALSERTRVRASFLAALEEMRLEDLPSRPFVVGYIRAYAQTVGADPDAAAQRFKAEEPVLDEALAAPVGVQEERDPRLGAIIIGAVVIIAAIVAWNVVQRIMTETAPKPPTASETVSEKALAANTTAGPVALGAPLPAPVESTTPPPYQTPGLDKALNAEGQPLAPPVAAQPQPEVMLDQHFTPKGQVYGAPAAQGSVVLQALKPAFLVVRGGDGSIYFARQLNEGEAYRAPAIGGLTVDVSEPDAFQVFSYGQSKGLLPQPLTDVGKLAGPPPAAPAPPKPLGPTTPAAPTAAPPATAAAPKPTPSAAAAKPKADATTAAKPAPAKAKTGAATPKPPAKPKAAASDVAPDEPPTAF